MPFFTINDSHFLDQKLMERIMITINWFSIDLLLYNLRKNRLHNIQIHINPQISWNFDYKLADILNYEPRKFINISSKLGKKGISFSGLNLFSRWIAGYVNVVMFSFMLEMFLMNSKWNAREEKKKVETIYGFWPLEFSFAFYFSRCFEKFMSFLLNLFMFFFSRTQPVMM